MSTYSNTKTHEEGIAEDIQSLSDPQAASNLIAFQWQSAVLFGFRPLAYFPSGGQLTSFTIAPLGTTTTLPNWGMGSVGHGLGPSSRLQKQIMGMSDGTRNYSTNSSPPSPPPLPTLVQPILTGLPMVNLCYYIHTHVNACVYMFTGCTEEKLQFKGFPS